MKDTIYMLTLLFGYSSYSPQGIQRAQPQITTGMTCVFYTGVALVSVACISIILNAWYMRKLYCVAYNSPLINPAIKSTAVLLPPASLKSSVVLHPPVALKSLVTGKS